MGLHHFFLLCQIFAIVRGDPLLDYANKSFEGLRFWIGGNVDDDFTFTYPSSSSRGSFMEFQLRPQNITGSGMNNIRLISNPAFAGSLYTGQVDVNLSVKVDLRLSGIYEASGFLFPYVDQIQFDSSGEWFTYISLFMTQRHHISTSVSIDGSITSEFSMSRYEPETFISHFYFDNFLEDHINQWYYPIAKEGFGKELEERAHRAFIYNEINVFREFFEKVFYNISYSDIVGSQM